MKRPVHWDARFKDLPLITITRCPMTDDDNDFHSDIMYMKALLEDIHEAALTKRRKANPFPIGLADELSAASEQLKTIRPTLQWMPDGDR